MPIFQSRRHRLELPRIPQSDDPIVMKRAMEQMQRLVMDEFNRLSTDLYDFKKRTFESAVLPLPNISNLAVVYDEYSVDATWVNPTQSDPVPTHVRVRILEISPNSWAEYTYPKTDWEFNGLDAGTQYTLQVQLVARFETTETFVSTTRNCPSVPVLRIAESDIKQSVFTTDDGIGPPTDPGLDDTNIDFPVPDTPGTPGTVGGSDCWWGYQFQKKDACAWADIGSETTEDGDAFTLNIDTTAAPFSSYDDWVIFRVKYREICDSITGDWVYGPEFIKLDWAVDPCQDIIESASVSIAPYDTADVFHFPGICLGGTGLNMVNYASGGETLFPLEPGFLCVEYDDSEWTIYSDATSEPVREGLAHASVDAILPFYPDSDWSIAFDLYITDMDLADAAGTSTALTIFEAGDLIRGTVFMDQSPATTYSIVVSCPREGGGVFNFTATGIPLATWVTVYFTNDISEAAGRQLFIDGELIDESANAIQNRFDDITNVFHVACVNDMRIRKMAMWSRALLPGEILPPGGVAGYQAGGKEFGGSTVQTIEKMSFPLETVSVMSATLPTVDSNGLGGMSNGGVAGYVSGHGGQDWIDKLSWLSDTTSALSAVLTSARTFLGGFYDDGVAGYEAGGDSSSTVVDKLSYSAETVAAVATGLTTGRGQGGGLNDAGVAGYLAGGVAPGGFYYTTIDKWTLPTNTHSVLAGVLTQKRAGTAAVSDPAVAGFVMGGARDATNKVDSIERLTFPGEVVSTLGAVLSSQLRFLNGMSNDGTAGYICGGDTTTIDRLDFSAETRSTLSATFTTATGLPAGLSNVKV